MVCGCQGYRNSDLITPSLDALASEGIILEEYYVYRFCGKFHVFRQIEMVPQILDPSKAVSSVMLRLGGGGCEKSVTGACSGREAGVDVCSPSTETFVVDLSLRVVPESSIP